MTPEQWQRVRAVFEAALELPAGDRAAWLQRELVDAPGLRTEVERLLAAEPAARHFLVAPGTATLDAARPSRLLGARAGDRLGPYELLRLIGAGGMGAVFEARRERPARVVALKVMRAGLDTELARRRFVEEIELLAKLQHPGIAAVFEAGTEGELPWFAMELLEQAQAITAYASSRGLTIDDRLDLMLQVAAAIQHAHQRGVIHRDLKPANILVDASGRAKVIDFGIARTTARDLQQLTEAAPQGLLGTLLYMSPERIAGAADDTDVRSDVYGLGVVLYELLAQRHPFVLDGMPLAAACRMLLERDPPPPTAAAAGLPRELDWITLRAMAKDRERRYASISEFAQDLQRFRRNEPLQAAPATAGYRLRKFLRRHRVGTAAAGLVLLVTIGAFVLVATALFRARAAEAAEREGRQSALTSARHAEAALAFLLDVFAAAAPDKTRKGKDVTMGEALDRAANLLQQRLAAEPGIRAALGHTIAVAYLGLGDLDAAERHLRESLELRDQAGESVAARAHIDLAYVLLDGNRLDEAEAELGRAETILQHVQDRRLQLVLDARRGDLLRTRGDKVAAKGVLWQTVRALQRAFGDQDHDTLLATNLLAGVLHELGDLDAAEPLYRTAMEGLLATKGEDHPDTLATMNNLAMVLFSRQPTPGSVAILERVLEVRRRRLGTDHPDTLAVLVNLGSQHYLLGNLDPALQAWEGALQAVSSKVPREHPVVQTLLLNLATAERDRGDYARAAGLNEEVLELRRRTLGADHDKTLVALTSLADIRRMAGDLEAAQELFRNGLQLGQGRQPPDLVATYRCRLGLGRIAAARREFEVAEAQLNACLASYAETVAAMAVKSLLTRAEPDLARLYQDWGKPEAAARFRKIAAEAGITF